MKKNIQFTIDIEIDIQENIELNTTNIKSELIEYEQKKIIRAERFLSTLIQQPKILEKILIEKGYFHLTEIESFEKTEEIEEDSQNALEEVVEHLENLQDIDFYTEAMDNNKLYDQVKKVLANFNPSIKKVTSKVLD